MTWQGRNTARSLASHHGHEEAGVALIEALAARLRVPKEHTELAVLTARHHVLCIVRWNSNPRPSGTLGEDRCLAASRALPCLLLACEADARGRTGLEERAYPQPTCCAKHRRPRPREPSRRGTSGLVGTAIKRSCVKAARGPDVIVTRNRDSLKRRRQIWRVKPAEHCVVLARAPSP